jgi:hypothetical protein
MQAKLLLSTAAVALMLTGPAAFAQSNPDKKPDAAKEQTQAKPAHESQRSEHNADRNKSAASDEKQSDRQATQSQSEQPKQDTQKSASEHQQKSDKNAQREMKEHNAQKQSSERSAKDSNNEHNKAATTKSPSSTGQSTADQQKAQDAQKNATTDQSKSSPSAEQNNTTGPNATSNKNATSPSNASNAANTTNTPNSRNAAQQNTPNTNGQQNTTNANAQLAPEKQTRISETISRTHDVAPPVRDLRVSINIGTRVPEHVRLHRLPSEIVSIEPAYREYDYFTTEQDIVIVNPHTRQVVTMVPRDASRARAEGGSSSQVSSMSSNSSMAGGSSMASSTSGSPPCQVMRREASGQTVPINPSDLSRSTTGSGSTDQNRLAVTVQAPNGQSMPPIALPDQTGQIVVATDGGDCKITIEPGTR